MKNFALFLVPCFLVLWLGSCKEEDNPEVNSGEIEIGAEDLSSLGLSISVSSESNLIVGYNSLHIALKKIDTQEPYSNALVSVVPMMEMPSMEHSAPTRIPEDSAGIGGRFVRDVVFIMPSGDMGSWTLEVRVRDLESGLEEQVEIPVNIQEPEGSKT